MGDIFNVSFVDSNGGRFLTLDLSTPFRPQVISTAENPGYTMLGEQVVLPGSPPFGFSFTSNLEHSFYIDSRTDFVFRDGLPLGSLGVDAGIVNGFTLWNGDGLLLTLPDDFPFVGIYRVNLGTGAATFQGQLDFVGVVTGVEPVPEPSPGFLLVVILALFLVKKILR